MNKDCEYFYDVMNKVHFYDCDGNIVIDLEEFIEDEPSLAIPFKLHRILNRVWYIVFDSQEIADNFSKLVERYIDCYGTTPYWNDKSLSIDNKSIWHYADDEWKPIFEEIKIYQNEINKLFDFIRSVISHEKS